MKEGWRPGSIEEEDLPRRGGAGKERGLVDVEARSGQLESKGAGGPAGEQCEWRIYLPALPWHQQPAALSCLALLFLLPLFLRT